MASTGAAVPAAAGLAPEWNVSLVDEVSPRSLEPCVLAAGLEPVFRWREGKSYATRGAAKIFSGNS